MNHDNALTGVYFGIKDQSSVHMLKILYWTVGLWAFAALLGGAMDAFNQPDVPPVALGIFLLAPIVGFILAYELSPGFKHAVDQIPLWMITVAHLWRLVGLGFVIGVLIHVLPPQFGYPEGFGDVIAALFCVPLAIAIRGNRRSSGLRTAFVVWNVYGLIDLLSAISMGILYSNGPLGVLRGDVSTALMVTFPVNLIPTFFVPLFILLHLLAIKRSRELA